MALTQPTYARRSADLLGALAGFVRVEAASAILLITVTLLALVVANSPLGALYEAWLTAKVGPSWLRLSALHWINDALMAVFFLLIGLEIKREVVSGALSSVRQASLPLFAAIGGMGLPAAIFVAMNIGNGPALPGWATPVATDIAFALGILTLVGSRAPVSLKVFLTALAVLDDLFVVLIIAVFYTSTLSVLYLLLGACGLIVLLGFNLLKVVRVWIFLLVGAIVWYCILRSGVHATLAGVLVALTIPIRNGDPDGASSPLHRLEDGLHAWVAWLIVPLFAFANAGVSFGIITWDVAAGTVSVGIVLALFIGKQAGILMAVWAATRAGLADLPEGTNFRHLHAVAVICGVGFTMSLFIGSLAFPEGTLEVATKVGVLTGSLLSGLSGYVLLRMATNGMERPHMQD
ncbi:MAG: Na+/H+ antiporter NhaA [Acetobacteraceae bacterium]|nr:Na+/H+ antiporter NhaA [Acetobacteraceae bacterium]